LKRTYSIFRWKLEKKIPSNYIVVYSTIINRILSDTNQFLKKKISLYARNVERALSNIILEIIEWIKVNGYLSENMWNYNKRYRNREIKIINILYNIYTAIVIYIAWFITYFLTCSYLQLQMLNHLHQRSFIIQYTYSKVILLNLNYFHKFFLILRVKSSKQYDNFVFKLWTLYDNNML